IGLYGVMSGYVSVRTRELGVRMVLGAQRMDVLRLVLRLGARTLMLGMTFGALAAFAVGRLLQAQLFETKPFDALTWMGMAAMLIIVGFAACLVPAGRAARLQPIEALRSE